MRSNNGSVAISSDMRESGGKHSFTAMKKCTGNMLEEPPNLLATQADVEAN
jgi:hypothetical protein